MAPDQRFVGWQPTWENGRLRLERIYGPRPEVVGASPYPSGAPVTWNPRPVVSETRGKIKIRRDTSHTFHLVMTVLTGGIWAIVWLLVTLWHQLGPRRKSAVRTRTVTR